MKISPIVAFVAITLLQISCREKDVDLVFNQFPKTINISGKPIGIKEIMRGGFPTYLDSLIILRAIKESGNVLYIYNRNSFDLIAKSIYIGRGPKEITLPGLISVDKENRLILCQDVMKRDLWKFRIDSILINPDYFPEEKSKLPNILSPFQIDPVNDSLFSIIDNNPLHLISFCNSNGEIIDTVPNILNIYNPKDLSRELLTLSAYYCYEKHPKSNRYAIVHHTSDIIAVIDSKGNLIRKIIGPSTTHQVPEYGSNQIKTNLTTDADEKLFYCSYLNKPRRNDEDPLSLIYPVEINVFDWDGNPRAKLVLDTSISSFAVDYENDEILAFSADSSDLIIFRTKLSDL
ncbi:MAG: TolB-like 6-bladed beta-propeller domain-containing protein [Bacteroidales bacterium]|nr:TolB-like 6-bladed beta-propeller domain-containing protein [Bacteroidales bacterium]